MVNQSINQSINQSTFVKRHKSRANRRREDRLTGQLILRRIVKIVATKCQVLRLKCTNIDFGLGELTVLPQTPYLDLRGPTSKGRDI